LILPVGLILGFVKSGSSGAGCSGGSGLLLAATFTPSSLPSGCGRPFLIPGSLCFPGLF